MEYFQFPICVSILCAMLVFYTESFSLRLRRNVSAVQFDQPLRDSRRCHDFCLMMPNLCRNGGSCRIDEGTCIGKCTCATGWSGQRCKDPVEIADTEDKKNMIALARPVELARDETNTNVTPIVKHIAVHNTEINRTTISSEIANDYSLSFQMHESTPNPMEDIVQSLDNKIAYPNAVNNVNGVNDVASKEICEHDCHNGKCIKVDNLYKCRQEINISDNSTPTVCGPGFECDHGVCDMEALGRNSFKCICKTNYVGQFCTLKCPLDCGEHGYCDYSVDNKDYKCFCQWNYTGQNCSRPIVENLKDDYVQVNLLFHWYVVGGCATLVVFILSALFLAAYFMWRKRLVFILRIVHYFQHYEDDDGKQYDAFVSYKSCPRDEKFVIQQLFPKLEGDLKFKLCLHFRDFIPGEAIANNILKAVEGSRRTIMILSRDYVQSEWCRMEYQTAQHEMLKLKHKIIPIVLENISAIKGLDRNLNSILSSVTYLEWPDSDNVKSVDRFWKRLELSLPKRSASTSQTTPSLSNNFSNGCDVLSSEITSSCRSPSSLSTLGISIPTSVCTIASSETITRSFTYPPKRHKPKEFKHFMEKLVKNTFFKRQDSNSSEAELVDEMSASQSSCESVTESYITESSDHDSMCSTPETPNSYLTKCSDTREFNPCFENCSIDTEQKWKELSSSICEHDMCDDTPCENCVKVKHAIESSSQSKKYLNAAYALKREIMDECKYCGYILQCSDNNRVRISSTEGSNKVKIQKVPMNLKPCAFCYHVIDKLSHYRGSMRHRKDVENFPMMKQNRVGSLQSYNCNTSLYIRGTSVKSQQRNDKEGHEEKTK